MQEHRASPAWSLILSVGLLCVVPLFVCACGHLDWMALFVTAPAAALAWRGLLISQSNLYATGEEPRGSNIIFFVTAVLIATLAGVVLGKNFADVAWLGHDPLWRLRG
jgi:hypothetical protein